MTPKISAISIGEMLSPCIHGLYHKTIFCLKSMSMPISAPDRAAGFKLAVILTAVWVFFGGANS